MDITGKIRMANKIQALFLFFEKIGNRMSKETEIIVKGAKGTQSFNILDRMLQNEPNSSIKAISIWGCLV